MASLMDLAVSLTAKTGKFSAGFKKAEKRVKRFTRGIVKLSTKVLKFGSIMGGAVAAGSMLMIRRSMKTIDATAKMSDRIGIATEKLQGLRHAAEITGAGTAALDKGLMYMAKSLGEAKQGTGEAKQALEALGIPIKKIIKLKPDEQFAMIADKMALLKTQSEKAYVASKIFGRGGLTLVNTLALGSKGLDQMTAEAIKLGVAFNRIDAAKVEQANDAITRMKAVFKGVFNVLAIQLSPWITALTDKFVEFATKGEGLGVKVAKAFKAIVATMIAVGGEIKKITGGFAEMAGRAMMAKAMFVKATNWEEGMKLQKEAGKMIRSAVMQRLSPQDNKVLSKLDELINTIKNKKPVSVLG